MDGCRFFFQNSVNSIEARKYSEKKVSLLVVKVISISSVLLTVQHVQHLCQAGY